MPLWLLSPSDLKARAGELPAVQKKFGGFLFDGKSIRQCRVKSVSKAMKLTESVTIQV